MTVTAVTVTYSQPSLRQELLIGGEVLVSLNCSLGCVAPKLDFCVSMCDSVGNVQPNLVNVDFDPLAAATAVGVSYTFVSDPRPLSLASSLYDSSPFSHQNNMLLFLLFQNALGFDDLVDALSTPINVMKWKGKKMF